MRSLLVLVAACGATTPRSSPAVDWPDGCFIYRNAVGRVIESDHARCSLPRRPYSTFKLANALIALDAGVLDNADSPMTWDPIAVPDDPDWPDVWRQPHTLRSAIEVSAVPHFRTLALGLGETRMAAGLAKLHYGNQAMCCKLDLFWLEGALRISAAEQLEFVDALAHGKLAVTAHAQEVVRDISVIAREDRAVLHGKTGSGHVEGGSEAWLMWQVGWVERDGAVIPYASWLETKLSFEDARALRTRRVRETLAALGVMPSPAAPH
ncbi:MAG: oxa5 [Myxococcales bacterium]|nr:oxa5 [Myxococcales bacterium]